MSNPILVSLISGLLINLFDVGITVAFAATPWTTELRRQGISPNRWTPPYYVTTSFVAGALLVWLYPILAVARGPSVSTALVTSVLMWLLTRIYGAGHVVMRQMPLQIFAVMSSGLLLSFIAAGQVVRWLLLL
jgi:hypothetical protein